uniref:Uncharacterized protein n=1 Tax=Glossina brevipalpis TaxID=37001 RepID=A0A1A9WF53_9MUSC
MISKKEQLLNQPWQQQRYMKHKNKVKTAVALIDHSPPLQYQHVKDKSKKLQAERERISLINTENVRLLQKLTEIMQGKRMPDLWTEPRPNFLGRVKLFKTSSNDRDEDGNKKLGKDIEKQNNNKITCPRCNKRAK